MSAQEADHYAFQAGGGVGEQKAVAELLAEGAQEPARRRKQIDDVEARARFPGEQYR
jgi:hypothetical protein